ncbi:MAG: hypothetical protein M1823_001483 [Watsoniomyces obsoletus]|nr:MAG: hypothetical protein M1823_001483 [Watsoniomyces obsoletus]
MFQPPRGSGPQGSGGGTPRTSVGAPSPIVTGGHGASQSTSGGGGQAAMTAATEVNNRSAIREYLTMKRSQPPPTSTNTHQEATSVNRDGSNMDNQPQGHGDAQGQGQGQAQSQQMAPSNYEASFKLLQSYVESSLSVYQREYRRVLWPIFAHSVLKMVQESEGKAAQEFLQKFQGLFEQEREVELTTLRALKAPEHVARFPIAVVYAKHKYQITLTHAAHDLMIGFMERNLAEGGREILTLLNERCTINTVDRPAANADWDGFDPADSEDNDDGPRHSTGKQRLANISLGPMPMDAELLGDVLGDLADEDARVPPAPGQRSLVEEFERHFKRVPGEDTPKLNEQLRLPPSTAADVAMEVQMVKNSRIRFRIDAPVTAPPKVDVLTFTAHNAAGGACCMEFSDDLKFVAIGTEDSVVEIFSLDGLPIPCALNLAPGEESSNRKKLYGHSGPVFSASWSPSIDTDPENDPDYKPEKNPDGTIKKDSTKRAKTSPRWLLTSSFDQTIRLWEVGAWVCLRVFKGHCDPVLDVKFGPFGYYFVSGGMDEAVRVWGCLWGNPERMMVGQDGETLVVGWHPNSAYVFSGSRDRMVRMWSASTGDQVRIFYGHRAHITALECSPDGKTLATADQKGCIFLWDLASGRRLKRMRGHRGTIWSMSWSVESTVIVTGGEDGTIRLWDARSLGPSSASSSSAPRTQNDPSAGVVAEGPDYSSILPEEILAAIGGLSTSTGPNPSLFSAFAGPSTAAAASTSAPASGSAPASASGPSQAPPEVTAVPSEGRIKFTRKKKSKDVQATPDQLQCFLTKQTRILKVKFTRTNMIVCGGVNIAGEE